MPDTMTMIKLLKKQPVALIILLLALLALFAACQDAEPQVGGQEATGATGTESLSPAGTPLPPATLEPTATPLPTPTPTPQLAALVNGQPILLKDYEQELVRFKQAQAALDLALSEDEVQARVINALIDRELIRQAAVVEGITVAPQIVEAKIEELRAAGESPSFDDWLASNLYTEDEFREALAAELIAEQMAAVVTADVPDSMEHLHVRYIQVDDAELAQSLLFQLREGADFAGLADTYSLDRVTGPYGGDLGWFTRGSLLVPEIEVAAFELEEGEISEVIAATDTDTERTTYYIVQLLERDRDRLLTSDLRHRLLQEAFDTWLATQRSGASVVSFLGGEGQG